MTISPFPPQDLAKLVLGYLAEEQLMTAYDEFLQASPYLDAFKNEYDRIFMTSLKNILAEYRAVKISVETCKPFVLRKRLLQCGNLLEIVKFLIHHVDLNKIGIQDFVADRSRNSSINTSNIQSKSLIESRMLQTSLETTPLADLPGNITTKKKQMRVIVTEDNVALLNEQYDRDNITEENLSHTSIRNLSVNSKNSTLSVNECGSNNDAVNTLPVISESVPKLEEFNKILNEVCKHANVVPNEYYSSCEDASSKKELRFSSANTLQDFTAGICYSDSGKVNVPNSSTSEYRHPQEPVVENRRDDSDIDVGPNRVLLNTDNLLLKVDTVQNPANIDKTLIQINNASKMGSNKKHNDRKIKILSNIKIEKPFNKINKQPTIPSTVNNATSTPLLQRQTVLVNESSAFKSQPQGEKFYNYTKDEIMAMPTIILVPSSGTSSTTTSSSMNLFINSRKSNIIMTTAPSQQVLKPLAIDISSDSLGGNSNNVPMNIRCNENTFNEQGLKTIEVTGHVSAPKDNTFTTNIKVNTPHMPPLTKKSLSTPRRVSHVRVLDFTTPRRILHEANPDKEDGICDESSNMPSKPLEVPVIIENDEHNSNLNKMECEKGNCEATKENKSISSIEINNWDSKLRALVVVNENETLKKPLKKSNQILKTKPCKKKSTSGVITENNTHETKKICNKKAKIKAKASLPKTKDTKTKQFHNEITLEKPKEQKINTSIKPTINFIANDDWNTNNQENNTKNDKTQNSNNASSDLIDTPENDRILLQNAIGAKLNISDLLETPYKQALYDIQMETPKFLGPDIPIEPISDIKIMNIPTPRFLCSPKCVQATPTYSTRPTDYSSGGSYYKPDDQDYVPVPEILECPITKTEESKSTLNKKKQPTTCEVKPDSKSKVTNYSRPIRKCTKNVSYSNNSTSSKKNKDIDKNIEWSDSSNDSSYSKNKTDTQDISKNTKENKYKQKRKLESKKSINSVKKYKSPIKSQSKKFIRIKPRRPTPTKQTMAKTKKVSDSLQSASSKSQAKKKIISKDKTLNLTSIVSSAPTKSRRKSSTPRKLHCTKTFNSESSEHNSPEMSGVKQDVCQEIKRRSPDPELEQLQLRWSDDGSQDGKLNIQLMPQPANDSDDISKIKEYIEITSLEKSVRKKEGEGSLQDDLIRRGFDVETAKIIERDLLDSPHSTHETISPTCTLQRTVTKVDVSLFEKSVKSDSSASNTLQILQEDDSEEVEFSVQECNENCNNFVKYNFVKTMNMTQKEPDKLKDNFSMEVCIDNGINIRLRATPFSILFDQDPQNIEINSTYHKETEIAVSLTSNIDKLYTPIKDTKAQVLEIFDSTLTSLDTPLKVNSPKIRDHEPSIADLVLQVEKDEFKDKSEIKKRKRLQSETILEDSINGSKRVKKETKYLLNSANIQNIDIESVLSKLHGP